MRAVTYLGRVGVVASLMGLAACGASQEEIASQAKAAAEAQAKAARETQVKAAEVRAKQAKAAAEADASEWRAAAESEAALLRSEASRVEAELLGLRAAEEEAQKKAAAASPAIAKLEGQLPGCQTRAGEAAERAAKLEAARVACLEQAKRSKQDCWDRSSAAASHCHDFAPHAAAHRACKQQELASDERCGATEEHACDTVWSQAYALGQTAQTASDVCKTLSSQIYSAGELARAAAKAPLRVSLAENDVRSKRSQADKLVADAKSRGDKLVADVMAHPEDFARCGTVRSAWVYNRNDNFCMDRTEVTTSAYAACVASGKCTPVAGSCNAGVAGRERHPINCVNWPQANAYCKAQGQRLPTKNEWEHAATGGDDRTYPWGNEPPKDQLCWNGEGNDLGKNNRKDTCVVGSYPKGDSPFGLSDMSGNVSEWLEDKYDFEYNISGRHEENYIEMNGGWDADYPQVLRVARSDKEQNINTYNDRIQGFRCVGAPSRTRPGLATTVGYHGAVTIDR